MAFIGDLDIASRAQIHNWIYTKIPGAKETYQQWIERYVVAHAITLLIAHRLKVEGSPEDEEALLKRSWEIQMKSHSVEGVGERIDAQDVDLECLRAFERKLFMCSREEGEASYNQWGSTQENINMDGIHTVIRRTIGMMVGLLKIQRRCLR